MSGSVVAAALAAAALAFAAAAGRAMRRAKALVAVGVGGDERDVVVWSDPRARSLVIPALAALGGFALAGAWGLAAGAALMVVRPVWARRRAEAGRRALVESQLGDAVVAIAAALRAGMSLVQGIAHAAGEVEEPLASSLRRLAERQALGEPLEDALARWSREVGGDDARLVEGVLRMHRRTGGDLPAVLDQVARTLRERQATQREVRALTAQARLSGAILGALPVGFFLFLSATSRRDIEAAFTTTAGIASIAIGLSMQGVAFAWIRRLLRVT